MTQKIEIKTVSDTTQAERGQQRLEEKAKKLGDSYVKAGSKATKAASAAEGSFKALDDELKENIRLLDRMEQGTAEYAAQKRKVERLAEAHRKAKNEVRGHVKESGSLRDVTLRSSAAMVTAVGSATALVAIMKKVADATREAREATAEHAVEVDTLVRRLQVQAGLGDDAAKKRGRQLLRIAKKRGVEKETAFAVETQSVSSGFKDDVTSEFIKGIQATNFQGPADELVKATAQFLKADGKELTRANVRDLLVDVQGLFKGTDLQATDLSAFAKVQNVLSTASLSQEQSLATLTALREIMPAAEAATATRNFITALQTAGAKKTSAGALDQLGLEPGDVDFVGEEFSTVLERLNDRLAKLPAEQANIVKAQLFGRENLAAAGELIKSADKIAANVAVQNNEQQFDRDAAVAADSRVAAQNRIAIEKDIRALGKAGDVAFGRREDERKIVDAFDAASDRVLANEKLSGIERAIGVISSTSASALTTLGKELGLLDDSAKSIQRGILKLGVGTGVIEPEVLQKERRGELRELMQEVREQRRQAAQDAIEQRRQNDQMIGIMRHVADRARSERAQDDRFVGSEPVESPPAASEVP